MFLRAPPIRPPIAFLILAAIFISSRKKETKS